MKKIVLALLISWSSYSQELVKNVTLNLSKKTDVFQIVEEDKKQVSFLADMIEKQILLLKMVALSTLQWKSTETKTLYA